MALGSYTEINKAADSTYRPLYVRRGANSWTRFSVTLKLLGGGGAKVAADGIFGALALLRLYTRL